jgi:hypothetical protein
MKPSRVAITVLSGLVTLSCVVVTIFILTVSDWYKAIPTLLIGGVFGFFTAMDVRSFVSR